jgi:hypothetical protein
VTSTVSTGLPRTIATALVLVLPARWVYQSVWSLSISCLVGGGCECIQCLTFKTWKNIIFPLVVSPRGTFCTYFCEEQFWKNESDGHGELHAFIDISSYWSHSPIRLFGLLQLQLKVKGNVRLLLRSYTRPLKAGNTILTSHELMWREDSVSPP